MRYFSHYHIFSYSWEYLLSISSWGWMGIIICLTEMNIIYKSLMKLYLYLLDIKGDMKHFYSPTVCEYLEAAGWHWGKSCVLQKPPCDCFSWLLWSTVVCMKDTKLSGRFAFLRKLYRETRHLQSKCLAQLSWTSRSSHSFTTRWWVVTSRI